MKIEKLMKDDGEKSVSYLNKKLEKNTEYCVGTTYLFIRTRS